MASLNQNDMQIHAILNKEYLNTYDAETYLTKIKGIQITYKTLRTHISRGGGPAFHKMNRRVYYTRQALDTWVSGLMSLPKSNSMDGGTR